MSLVRLLCWLADYRHLLWSVWSKRVWMKRSWFLCLKLISENSLCRGSNQKMEPGRTVCCCFLSQPCLAFASLCGCVLVSGRGLWAATWLRMAASVPGSFLFITVTWLPSRQSPEAYKCGNLARRDARLLHNLCVVTCSQVLRRLSSLVFFLFFLFGNGQSACYLAFLPSLHSPLAPNLHLCTWSPSRLLLGLPLHFPNSGTASVSNCIHT